VFPEEDYVKRTVGGLDDHHRLKWNVVRLEPTKHVYARLAGRMTVKVQAPRRKTFSFLEPCISADISIQPPIEDRATAVPDPLMRAQQNVAVPTRLCQHTCSCESDITAPVAARVNTEEPMRLELIEPFVESRGFLHRFLCYHNEYRFAFLEACRPVQSGSARWATSMAP
jgi:hypothetical protein